MTSKTQVDKLGERLKCGEVSEADIKLLHDYRQAAGHAYTEVFARIKPLGLHATGRPAKSTTSIVDKLRRETARLSQMQDVAGCRVVVEDLTRQDEVVAALTGMFANCLVIDRRESPSHGYRAVHVIVRSAGVPVEVQVRTGAQHAWAEYSEKLADLYGIEVKYGGGDATIRRVLDRTSELTAEIEQVERDLTDADPDGQDADIKSLKDRIEKCKSDLLGILRQDAKSTRN